MKKILLCFMLLFSTLANAQWPEKTITIINPYAPGGGNDRMARLIAVYMQSVLNKPVVVVNHAGGSNIIAINEMEKMDPDYTFMFPNNEIVTGPASQGKDSYKNFHPVTIIATAPQMLYTNPSTPKDDFINKVKRGESVSVGNAGMANPATAWIEQMYPGKIQHIPFKGGAPAVFAVVSNHVEYGAGTIANGWNALSQGQIVPVMIGDTKRSPLLPNVPTYLELGFTGKPSWLWYGLIASNKINPEVEARVFQIIRAMHDTPGLKQLSDSGLSVHIRSKQESQKIYDQEIANLK